MFVTAWLEPWGRGCPLQYLFILEGGGGGGGGGHLI